MWLAKGNAQVNVISIARLVPGGTAMHAVDLILARHLTESFRIRDGQDEEIRAGFNMSRPHLGAADTHTKELSSCHSRAWCRGSVNIGWANESS